MKVNPFLEYEIERYKDCVIVVEGKKDVLALNNLGFNKVHQIHQTSVSLKERAEEIASQIGKKDKICILTDFDKEGKKLYLLLKSVFQELGVRLDASLRGILLRSGISHIEGLDNFMEKLDEIS